MKYNFITQLISVYTLLFLKVSICLFIARLGPRPIYKRICYGTASILTVYTIACGFTITFQCTPIERIWDRMGVEGTCFPPTTLLGLAYTHVCQSREHLLRSRSSTDPLHSCACPYRFFTCRPTDPFRMECPNPNPPEDNPHYCAGTRFIVGIFPSYILIWTVLTYHSAAIASCVKLHYIINYGKTGDFLCTIPLHIVFVVLLTQTP